MGTLRIEPTKESELATGAGLVRTVWGFVHENEAPRTVYFAREGGDPGTRRGVGVLARKHQGRLAPLPWS